MPSKLNVPPAIQRRAVRQLDRIANDPNSPVHSATTAARTLLARANREPDDDGRPENRPPLVLLPDNHRDPGITAATRKRILAGEFITVIPLYNDGEPDYEAKNAELIAAITATLDLAYPEAVRDPDDPEAAQLVDAEHRRKARDKKRRQRAAAAAEVGGA
jgi:hypothetical protein